MENTVTLVIPRIAVDSIYDTRVTCVVHCSDQMLVLTSRMPGALERYIHILIHSSPGPAHPWDIYSQKESNILFIISSLCPQQSLLLGRERYCQPSITEDLA